MFSEDETLGNSTMRFCGQMNCDLASDLALRTDRSDNHRTTCAGALVSKQERPAALLGLFG